MRARIDRIVNQEVKKRISVSKMLSDRKVLQWFGHLYYVTYDKKVVPIYCKWRKRQELSNAQVTGCGQEGICCVCRIWV